MPDRAENSLTMWTIYDRPADYPEGCIARCHVVTQAGSTPTQHVLVADSLDALRDKLRARGLGGPLPRSPEDPPQIVETWL